MTVSAPLIVQIVLGWPPPELNPNAHVGWRVKAPLIASYRDACKVDALTARRAYELRGVTFPMAAPMTMIVAFFLPSLNKRTDLMNLYSAFKAGEDGLVDAGIIQDDRISVVDRVTLAVERGEPAIRVRLEGGS